MTRPADPSFAAHPFAGGGEVGALMAALDWRTTPLGPVRDWSPALAAAVQLMLPASAEIALLWGPDHVALYNDAYAPTIGDKHPRALGRPGREVWTELWDDLRPLLDHVRTTGETFSAKDRPFQIDRHGYLEEVFFDVSYSPVREADGSVGGVLCIVGETTERVRASRQATADRDRLGQMFDQAPSFMALLREPGHVFELANASYQKLVGRNDLLGRRVADALPEMAGQGFVELLDRVVATRQPFRGEAVRVLVSPDPGRSRETLLDFVYQPITDASGEVTGVFVEGVDVTHLHLAEERLALSQASLKLATDAAEIGIWDLDLPAGKLDWSARTKAMFGISPDVPCSMDDFYAGLHPDDLDRVTTAFAAAIDPERRAVYDTEYRTIGQEDGRLRWVAAKGRGVFDPSGRCVRAIGTTLDITARKAVEGDLREREERFRTLADSVPALIWLTDADRQIVFANRHFEAMFGVDPADVHGERWRRLVHSDDLARFMSFYIERGAARRPWALDVRVIDRNGAVRWIHAEAQPRFVGERFAGYVGCAVDVTDAHLAAEALEQRIAQRTHELATANDRLRDQIAERERVEATLHQMQRLEAVGQLTSGVAHDFNNLLTVVLGNVELIGRAARIAGLDARTLRRLEHVRTAAERGATLTAQLLAFSRRQRLEARAVDLNETVTGMGELMASSLGGAVAIDTALAPDLWPALVDPTQIELIILNLAINARDAMDVGGRLLVETANVTLGAPSRSEEPAAGDYVMVAVSDTGTGMSEEVLARAFEPFFTTKEIGKGSGLGLAQVYGFAKQSGGGVRIDTRLGEGTTVRVYLPRTAPAAPVEQAAAEDGGDRPADCRVLVVDDDAAVRAVTVDTLADMGCTVLEASGGSTGLSLLAEHPDLAVAVVDFAMPGMNGAEFARAAEAQRPGLPVLFVTGYAELEGLGDVPEDRVLQKPYRAAELQARVRRLLGG